MAPVTAYEDYLRRYLPDEAEKLERERDPVAWSEKCGRQAVERALAQVLGLEGGLRP